MRGDRAQVRFQRDGVAVGRGPGDYLLHGHSLDRLCCCVGDIEREAYEGHGVGLTAQALAS